MSHLLRRLIDTIAPTGLPVLALAAVALLPSPWPAYILLAAGLAYNWQRHGANGLSENRVGRVLMVSTLLLAVSGTGETGPSFAPALAAVLLTGLIAFEPLLVVALGTRRVQSANLASTRSNVERWFNTRSSYVLISVLLVGFLVTDIAEVTAWPLAVACIAATIGFAVATAVSWRDRRRHAHSGDSDVAAAVAASEPKFLVHFAAPPGSEYQLLLWLPYFAKLGDPYVIVLRDRQFLPQIAAATTAPIVVAPTIAELEAMLAPTVKAVFYVNNSMYNAQCVRFAELIHVQLMHGDSDKPPSYNPIAAMYDRIFVAGQAGVDRYRSHGVDIPSAKFRIVGHPQVTAVDVPQQPRDPQRSPVALYAPTWTGLSTDADFCSLPIARDICKALLDCDATIIMRPHPYTRRNPASARQLDAVEKLLAEDVANTGRKHLFGKVTSQQMSLIECINAADVMVTDASGAASDWLYSEKPFAVTDVTQLGERLTDELPLARAAYVIESDASNLTHVCQELLVTDSLASARLKMKTYYLGEFSAPQYEDAFVSAARDCYR